ncbi:ribosomal protein S18-alanine N-acetyltransferase [Periweissella fabalis]|uniref:[Ribosomal protein bS18]-alanine N-acetyltransferase n=1 Tax=Periweissella fabalis TaxID=1070421 RepID=A0A7X6N406_9LACO|nr:ribosomal protein S18-alanine N-acetyltransferase [Periweissella fabalis]MCM0598704.1 ribosomal protein S18-alanine N-acetyltransferase [Periweissella fabalis]NKZ24357.1 ribosomal protein S18-alanine N-acetyltransferase [Periweissella fabalis]
MKYKYRQPVNANEVYNIADVAYHGSPWSSDVFHHDLANEHASYLVLTVDEQPIGFVAGTLIIDELSISNVAILPAFQRQHMAELLLKEWFSLFDDGIRVLLEVRAKNIAAQKLYIKLGFQEIAQRQSYYQHPIDDALIMEKIL